MRKLHQRSEVIADILRSGSGADPELSSVWRRWQDRHLEAVRAVVRSLAAAGALRDGVDVQTAADVLYAIGGPETFRQLIRERGRTPGRYKRQLIEAGDRLLLAR